MLKYTTIQDDTWDTIAFRVYNGFGEERLTSVLISANPEHIDTVIFPAGVELNVPEAYIPAAKTLPAWMR